MLKEYLIEKKEIVEKNLENKLEKYKYPEDRLCNRTDYRASV